MKQVMLVVMFIVMLVIVMISGCNTSGQFPTTESTKSVAEIVTIENHSELETGMYSTESTERTEPAERTEQTERTEPTEPTEPAEPTEPVEPTEPTEPAEPTNPAYSADSVEAEQYVTDSQEEALQGWRITQYGGRNGQQKMFYTIEGKDGGLVVIDGGYAFDEQIVRNVIAEHDNYVDAWIITHPHPDHVGAFNAIFVNPGDIDIEQIYTIRVNHERYQETAQDYDRFEVYVRFKGLTENHPKVKYVNENDEWEMLGLKFKVLHVWDEGTDMLDENLCNNGSMMFVVSGEKDKMLFCSDVESESQIDIINNHKDELDVDYVQLGHHGNWGLTAEFYEYTSPDVVFFDAPDWLFDASKVPYDAPILKDYFEKKDVKIYQFTTAPNEIILY